MTCIRIEHGFICAGDFYRLRLLDGRYVFMAWHSYCGPDFYKDKYLNKPIDEWWEDNLIIKALEWFQGRGNKA